MNNTITSPRYILHTENEIYYIFDTKKDKCIASYMDKKQCLEEIARYNGVQKS